MIAETLKTASRPQHESAESSTFITALMRGALDLEAYKRYLINLAWLYEALESKVAQGDPFSSTEPLWDARLNRLISITQDLEALGVSNWKATTKPTNAMASYIAHLEQLKGKSDLRLVAHHYTRYLGDLSGGQAISALVARHYGATPEQLTFYRFNEIDDLVRYKETYRANLDSLVISQAQLEELVDEVKKAFEFNQRVFENLAS
jgi:heme oxygenase